MKHLLLAPLALVIAVFAAPAVAIGLFGVAIIELFDRGDRRR